MAMRGDGAMGYRGMMRRGALAVGALALIGAAACGGEAKGASGPASELLAVATDGTVTIVAKDNVFQPKAFTAPANQPVTLTLDNKGAAIHNWAIAGEKGPDGKEFQTALIQSGQQGTASFTLPAGTYDFYCPVHPVEMRGKLTVR